MPILNFLAAETAMFEIVLYAAAATVVCVVFYSVLGKQVGRGDGDDAVSPQKYMGDPKPAEPSNASFIPDGAPTGLRAIAAADSNFSPAQFIDGAKAAYSMILEAFAEGDREQLGSLLSDEVYAVYDAAITEREANGHRQVTDLGRLRMTSIDHAELDGNVARIHVLYEADLTSALLDAEGEVVMGDPEILSSISEVWTYERDLKSDDPNWKLSEVAPSEGDDLEADPTPDTKA